MDKETNDALRAKIPYGLSVILSRIFGDSNRADSIPDFMNTGFMPPLKARKWILSPEWSR